MKKIEIILTRGSRNPIGYHTDVISSIVQCTVYYRKLYHNVRLVLMITKLNNKLSKGINNLHAATRGKRDTYREKKERTHSYVMQVINDL